MSGETVARKFRGFISYSKKDKVHAARLHKALEAFRVPKGAVGEGVDAGTRRLGRFFRDDDEMGAASNLGAALRGAIEDAESLIVICSPNAARSVWVNQEIVHFKLSGRADRIFAVIVEGTPHATTSDDPKQQAQECFPPALRFEVEPGGMVSDRPEEPLAIDLRKEPFPRVRARLAAGLTGVDFDDLWRRDRRRAQGRMAAWTAAAAGIVAAAGLGTWLAFTQIGAAQKRTLEAQADLTVAEAERQKAVTERAEVEQANTQLDAQAKARLSDAINQRGITALTRAESYFTQPPTDVGGDPTTILDKEAEARWSAASLAYANALSMGDGSRLLIDRLGYVQIKLDRDSEDEPKPIHVTSDGSKLVFGYMGGVGLQSLTTDKARPVEGLGEIRTASDTHVAEHMTLVAEGPQVIKIIDVATGAGRSLEMPSKMIDRPVAAFSHSGSTVAVAQNGFLTIWRTSDGAKLEETYFAGRKSADYDFVQVPALTAETLATLTEEQKASLSSFTDRVFFMPGDQRIVVLQGTTRSWVYDLQKKTWTSPNLDFSESDFVAPVSRSSLLTGFEENEGAPNEVEGAQYWNLDTGKMVREFRGLPCTNPDRELCIGPVLGAGVFGLGIAGGGRYFTMTGKDGKVLEIHDLQSGAKRENANIPCEPDFGVEEEERCGLVFSVPVGSQPLAVVNSGPGNIRMVDLAAGTTATVIDDAKNTRTFAISALDDGSRVFGLEWPDSEFEIFRLVVLDPATRGVLSRSGMFPVSSFQGKLSMDKWGRTIIAGDIPLRSLSPAGETIEEALSRLCAVRGAEGMKLAPDHLALFPAGTEPDVCKWPRPPPATAPSTP